MILTVTPHPALDSTWHVDALHPGETHRVEPGSSRAGGKGLNVARVLHGRGHDVIALATVGGPTGEEFREEIEASGIPHALIDVAAPTRRSIAIVDEGTGATSVFNERGASLEPQESGDLMRAAERLGHGAAAVAICGSLRPGFGPDELGALVGRLVDATAVIVDTSGPGMLAAAAAGAHVLKPNLEELVAATGITDPIASARALTARGARLVLVSLGADGLLVVPQEGMPLRARLPRPLRGNAVGAGDAMVAAVAAALADDEVRFVDRDGDDARRDLARRAVAWSAAAVLMPLAGDISPRHVALEKDVLVTNESGELP